MILNSSLLFSLFLSQSTAVPAFSPPLSDIIERLSDQIEKNDIRYGNFRWTASYSEDGIILLESSRLSDDCSEKPYLEVQKKIAVDLCKIKSNGQIEVRPYAGGESLDFAYGAGLGKSFLLRNRSLPPGGYENLTLGDILYKGEALGQAAQSCDGTISLTGYRNFSLRFYDARGIYRTLDSIISLVCKESDDG